MLSARHASERLLNCWHGGSKDIEQLREEIKVMLKEYLVSKDIDEIARCLRELAIPFYHHEFVRRALEMALDKENDLEAIEKLLSVFSRRGEISVTQMKEGFDRMEAIVDDLKLDYPKAEERFGKIRDRASRESWMEMKD